MENHYKEKLDEYLINMNNLMFTFEVTKCCGYSTFITIYKNQTLMELYSNIIHHFGNIQIKDLYFITTENERINIPLSNMLVSDFVSSNVIYNPRRLVPIYELPKPVIYRLYMNDGYCNDEYCTTTHYRH